MTDAANPAHAPVPGEPGVTLFVYRDAGGTPLFHVTRAPGGSGFDRPGLWGPTPDHSGWQPDLTTLEGPLPLYDLSGILAYRDAWVVFHRDERDAFRAGAAGLEGVHTTTVMGAGHAAASDFAPLAGRRVVVVPDATAEGHAYAAEVAGLARAAGAASVTVVHLPDPAPGAGLGAWLAAGGTPARWSALLAAQPAGRPAGASAPPAPPSPGPPPAPVPRAEPGRPPAFGEPTPLPGGPPPVPAFDPGLLPEALAAFVADVAARTGSPAVVPAVAVLVTLGAVVGRNLGIRSRSGAHAHPVVPNLWGAVVAEGAACLDTAALEEALAPLERLEWRAREAFVREDAHYRARKAAYGIALKVWRDRVRRQAEHGEEVAALAALHPPEPDAPTLRRYRTGPGTAKALVAVLNTNPGGALLAAGDLAAWVRNRAAPEREGERDFLLRCAAGGAPGFALDLPTGAALHCAHPCLSVLGWITADARARLLAPGIDQAGAHDLLSRFTLTVCPDRPAVPPPGADPQGAADARSRAEAVFERVDETVRGAGGSGTPSLPFDAAAQAFADAWQADHAVRVAGIDDAGLALALARQGEAMPALALVLHLAETADGGAPRPVPAAAARRAAAWCEHLEAHARRLHGSAGPAGTEAVEGARALLRRLVTGELAAPFTVRDVYRRHWSGLATRGLAQAAVELLERHGYLAPEPVPTTARGGKPTRVYHLNPRAAAGAGPA